jgi:hypothetical protein
VLVVVVATPPPPHPKRIGAPDVRLRHDGAWYSTPGSSSGYFSVALAGQICVVDETLEAGRLPLPRRWKSRKEFMRLLMPTRCLVAALLSFRVPAAVL